jgi:hypothetical protein
MIVYWSYNGTFETNITGNCTTPLLGPDGSTIQQDLCKLGDATTKLTLTSWSLVKTGGIGANSRGLQESVHILLLY